MGALSGGPRGVTDQARRLIDSCRGVGAVSVVSCCFVFGGFFAIADPVQKKLPDEGITRIATDPLLESFFDVKGRQVPERLRGVINGAVRDLDRESVEIRRRARARLISLYRAAAPQVREAIRGENRPLAVGALLVVSATRGGDELPLLNDVIQQSNAEEVRAAAALVAGLLPHRRGASILGDLLLEKRHTFARLCAGFGLARLRDLREQDRLLSMIQRRDDQKLTAVCAFALGRIGASRESFKVLVDLLREGSSTVRQGAVLGIAESGNPAGAKVLLRIFRESSGADRRIVAAAMGLVGDDEDVQAALRAELDRGGKDGDVKAACLRALAPFALPVDWDVVIEAFRSPNHEVRVAAAAIAHRYDPAETRPRLVRALVDSEPPVRGTAALALAVLSDGLAMKLLRAQLLRETDEETRLDLCLALAWVDSEALRAIRRGNKSLFRRDSARENMLFELVDYHPAPRSMVEEWVRRRLRIRGPSAESGFDREVNRFALKVLSLDRLEDRPVIRGESIITRKAPIFKTDLRDWLSERPYFDRMNR